LLLLFMSPIHPIVHPVHPIVGGGGDVFVRLTNHLAKAQNDGPHETPGIVEQ
jgi:hypothetical protein